MIRFMAFDNNVYITYFAQEGKPWLEKINELFSKIRELQSEVIINKSTERYVTTFIVSISNLLSDKLVKNDLKRYASNKDKKTFEKIKLFIESTDPKQVEAIISSALCLLKRGRHVYYACENTSSELRKLIDENIIQSKDCGSKTSKFILALSKIDNEDAIVLSQVYAIKSKHYSTGCFCSEDPHFFEVKENIDPNKDMGFHIEHIKDLNISTA